MLARLNQDSRRCIFHTRTEADQLKSKWVEIEHLLLGLIRQCEDEENTAISQFLGSGVTLEMIRQKVLEAIPQYEDLLTNKELHLSTDFKNILADMLELADELRDNRIGLEYFLYGILKQTDSNIASLLIECGLNQDAVKARILSLRQESVE